MNTGLSFSTMSSIQRSWEIARHNVDCIENVGPARLHILLERNQHFKKAFGFRPDRPIQILHPMVQASLLVHGNIITQLLDDTVDFLAGPDAELLDVFLHDMIVQHQRLPVDYFRKLGEAVRIFLQPVLQESPSSAQRTDQAWEALFTVLDKEKERVQSERKKQQEENQSNFPPLVIFHGS